MVDLLFNLLLLIFWVRVADRDPSPFYYNPYVAWINRISRTAIHWIRRRIPGITPVQAALAIVGGLVALRAAMLSAGQAHGWMLTFGFMDSLPGTGLLNRLTFSVASFGIVLFYLSVIHEILHRYARGVNPWDEFLVYVLAPFAAGRDAQRRLRTIGLGIAVSLGLAIFAQTIQPGLAWPPPGMLGFAWRILVNTAAAALGVLPVMQGILMVAIIGSWVTMLSPADGVARFCLEGVDYLIGPLRRYRLVIGPLDLTPLLALLLMGIIHAVGRHILAGLY